MARFERLPTATIDEIRERIRATDPVWNFLKSFCLSEEQIQRIEDRFCALRERLRLHMGERVLVCVWGLVPDEPVRRFTKFFKMAPILDDKFKLEVAGDKPVLRMKTGSYAIIESPKDNTASFFPNDLPIINLRNQFVIGELAVRDWSMGSTGHLAVYQRLSQALEAGLTAPRPA